MTFAPRTWVVGEVVTAAYLNQEVRDQFNSIISAWTSYTPVWTAATTPPALGNGTLLGAYMKVGRTCHVQLDFTAGSTTTYGAGQWSFSLPAQATAVQGPRIGLAQANGTIRAAGHTNVSASATTFQCFFPQTSSVSNLSPNGAANPFTWASGNTLRCTLTYETAA
ncbi:hypothetical protein ACIQKB_04255 [Streptomyces sp. NPDC092046]|uniref:hypothetical protein n=1 Tax=Streptomyces sp. NPDC092046 TaxID=3366009 RepID=UPI00382853BC